MRFEYLKIWSRWYWLPYKEETVLDMSFRWLCFEAQFKRQPTQLAHDWRESAPSAELTAADCDSLAEANSRPPAIG